MNFLPSGNSRISPFIDDLLAKSRESACYILRNLYGDSVCLLWISNVPEKQSPAQFQIAHPLGDFYSHDLSVIKFNDSTLQLSGMAVFPRTCHSVPLSLNLSRVSENYEGVLKLLGSSDTKTVMRFQDCCSRILLEPFEFNEPTLKPGEAIWYGRRWWTFNGWEYPMRCHLSRTSDDGLEELAYASYLSCRRRIDRQPHQDASLSVPTFGPNLSFLKPHKKPSCEV